MKDADLVGSDLTGANLSHSDLGSADLRFANLSGMQWQEIKSIKSANIAGIKSAPEGFIQWALQNGAVEKLHDDE
jgi:uncharacterized protein YjbI with pentapeptide repeats